MTDVIIQMFSFSFIQRAIIVGLLICLCCALLGVCLVLKRYSMIGDGLSHVGFGAMAVAAALNATPLVVAVPTVIVAAFLLLRINNSGRLKGDSAIAVISTGSLAVGIIVLSVSKGMNTDVYNYMFGSILSMSSADVWISIVLSATVIVLFFIFYHHIFLVVFDENFAKATGINVDLFNMLIAVLTAVTVVLGMRMMGAMLISALIIFPALSSMAIFKTYRSVVTSSVIISVFAFLSGLFISYVHALPTGASIVTVNLFIFILLSLSGFIKNR